jgi:CBS domain containing-hemolysin-like protein
MNELLWPFTVIIALLLMNGLFVGAEFAIAAAPETRVARLAEGSGDAARRLVALLRNRRALQIYISTSQIGITVASLALGMYGEYKLADWVSQRLAGISWLGSAATHALAALLVVTLLTYLHVVIGEMIPKSLALASPTTIALRLAGPMRLAQTIFLPVTLLLNWAGDRLLRLVGIPPLDAQTRLVSSAELEYIVEESTAGGFLEPAEQLYLENVLDFGERTIGQVMTPRTRMVALPVTATLEETLATIAEHSYSRYPVYEEDRDHVIGILHVKDFARQISQGLPLNLQTLMRPAVFVPESLPLEAMLNRFRRDHIQIAVVVDEFGGTAGLITLEDLLEELIGEIQDEFDEEIAPISELTPTLLRLRGDLLIDELNQHYALDIEHDEADTVGGLVMAHLGRVPQSGEDAIIDNLRFEVESTEGLAVNTLLLHLPTPPPPTHEPDGEPELAHAEVKRENAWSTSA